MLTNISNMFPFQEKEMGYLAKDGTPPKAGESYPIYIPRLMPQTAFGTPNVSTMTSQGVMVFQNAPQCRVYANRIMHCPNYVNVPFERNKTWGLDQKTVNDKTKTETIHAKTQITCNCKTNLLTDMTFSND